MTAHDTLHEAKFDEAHALRRELRRLKADNERLHGQADLMYRELELVRGELAAIRNIGDMAKKPAPHPGQMKIEGT